MKAIKEITLKELQTDYGWRQVFADDNAGNVSDKVEAVPPGSKASTATVSVKDVVKIIAAANGNNDGPDWVGVFLLKDGRYIAARGGCDYTGWDCRAFNSLEVATTLNKIIRFGLSDAERLRLNLPLRGTK